MQSLRGQIQALEQQAAGSRGMLISDDGSTASTSPNHPSAMSGAVAHTALAAQRQQSATLDSELGRLRGQVVTAGAVVFVTRRAVASCLRVISPIEPPIIAEDLELDVALLHMKVCVCVCGRVKWGWVCCCT